MSLNEKYSPVDPESALALCEAEFSLVTIEKFANGWLGAVGAEKNLMPTLLYWKKKNEKFG